MKNLLATIILLNSTSVFANISVYTIEIITKQEIVKEKIKEKTESKVEFNIATNGSNIYSYDYTIKNQEIECVKESYSIKNGKKIYNNEKIEPNTTLKIKYDENLLHEILYSTIITTNIDSTYKKSICRNIKLIKLKENLKLENKIINLLNEENISIQMVINKQN